MDRHIRKIFLTIGLITVVTGYSCDTMAEPCKPAVASDQNNNSCIGTNALSLNMTGFNNTAMGYKTLENNATGNNNSALGIDSLTSNTTGSYNSAMGGGALWLNTKGNDNTAIGYQALHLNITGNNNSATGQDALYSNTIGNNNSTMGFRALYSNTTGANNIAIGYYAGYFLTTGSNNVAIANAGVAGESAAIRIGTQGTHTAAYLAGVYGVNVANASFVTVTPSGQLGIYVSSRRYKEDIKPMGSVSDRLLELRPVTFHYKKPDEDGKKPIQYGLIAEEVDAVMPELVVRNKDGSPETVAYQYIPSLLLNEYQKQHKELLDTKAKLVSIEAKEKNSEQQISELKSQVERLNAITKKLMAALPATTKTAMAK